MAKRADQFQEDPPKQIVDAKKRKAIILETVRELDRIAGEVAELNEEAKKLRHEKIKGHLGMTIADFNATVRLYHLEGDDRSAALDTMREVYQALCPGQQLDWVDAQEKGAGNGHAEAATATH